LQTDECLRGIFQTVNEVLAIDAAVSDTCSNFAQEVGVVLLRKFVVDEAAQRQAL
jgi:hypothetical protein